MTEPTDAELMKFALENGVHQRGWKGILAFARAVLAKWGTPQPTQAQAGAVPLTDEQIHAIYDEVARREPYSAAVTRRNVVRAIEAAHGIGIKGGQQ